MQNVRQNQVVTDQAKIAQTLFVAAFQHYKSGRLSESSRICRQALSADLCHAESLHLLGVLAHQEGRPDHAIALVRQAIAINPTSLSYHSNLGGMLREIRRPDEAIICFRKVLELNPDHPEANYRLGSVLAQQERLDESIACFRLALELKPNHHEAYFNLGNVFARQGRLDEAIACFQTTIDLKPDHAETHNNLGAMHKELGQLDEAVDCFRKAILLKPDLSDAYSNLGNVLMGQMRVDEASAHYARALELKPDNFLAFSNQLFTQNYLVDQPPALLREKAWQYGVLATGHARPAFANWPDQTPGQPLRVGLVSSDLRSHPVGYFLEGLLRAADPARIAFLAFPSRHAEDELTARIKPHFQAWTPIHGLGDEAAARLIRDSGVQVLLDLSGHTGHNRLPVFAWRPAPVQATWLGYFATTGVAEIDYVVGDPHVAPPEEAGHFTETVWRLPEIYYCFTPPAVAVEVSDLPALAKGCLTFGCFNNLTKLNDTVLAVWARILHAVPRSRLLLKAPQLRDASVRASIHDRFAAHGIGAERLLIELPSSRADYLQAYHRIDIALDPFPYPGGTTSCEALWMGLPVLTRRGDRFLSHAGETILRNAGLPDWIAEDNDHYVARAVHFASDLDRLAHLRAQLRAQVLASPLFDAPRFARHFEDAMEGMWRRKDGQAPL